MGQVNKLAPRYRPICPKIIFSFLFGFYFALVDTALAQITPDATLGNERSRINSEAIVRGRRADRIEGGAIRGRNLFHSFTEFNVREGQHVYFNDAGGIENIFSRVTGAGISEILGTLGVEGQANLVLLNPNGIVFGPNARLDIRGSFVASTANRLRFADGSEFSTINPQTPPLLMVSVPLGLQGVNLTGTITNRGNLLAGQDLSLAAANLDLQGQIVAGRDLNLYAQNTLRVRDSSISPFIAASGRQLTVQGNQTIDLFTLNHSSSGFFSGSDMQLRSANPINGDAHYWSGGHFRIEQLNGIPGNLVSLYDPVIRSFGDVSLSSYQGASLHILAGGRVNITDKVVITRPDPTAALSETITLSDGTQVEVAGGSRATLDIRAGVEAAAIGEPQLIGFPTDFIGLNNTEGTAVPTNADININRIVMRGREASNGLVLLTNQYRPNLALPGSITIGIATTDITTGGDPGDSGSLIIDSRNNIVPRFLATTASSAKAGDMVLLANDTIFLTDGAALTSATLGAEDAGDIRIQTGSLVMNRSQIDTVTAGGTGNAGNLSITARDGIQLSGGSRLTTSALSSPPEGERVRDIGNSGNLTIQTGTLSLQDLSLISTATDGRASAGDLNVQARDSVTLDRLSLITASSFGERTAGNIAIETGSLTVRGGSGITNLSVGQGDAGNLSINAATSVNIAGAGSGISTSVLGIGNGGQLSIETRQLNVQNGAGIFTSTFDPNTLNAGTRGLALLRLVTPELLVDLTTSLNALTNADFQQGNSGNLTVRARDSITLNGGLLSTAATGRASGGDLLIETPRFTLQPGGFARTDVIGSGNAGSLQVRGASLVEVLGGRIAAETAKGSTGDGGNIRIEAQVLQVQNGGAVTSSTSGQGDAGNVTIVNADRVDLIGRNSVNSDLPSLIAAQVNSGSTGQGGNLTIATRRLNVHDGASISVATAGTGDAGNLLIRGNQGSSERVVLDNQGNLSARSTNQGRAGNLTVDTEVLSLQNNGRISATNQSSQGGDIQLQNLNTVLIDNSEIAASTQTGRAGNIQVDSANSIRINNRGILAVEATEGGIAGNLVIRTGQLNLQNRGRISVSSSRQGQAGTLEITAENLRLNNRARITAETDAGNGGDILLQIADLLRLDELSTISASTNNGQGGNLRVNQNRNAVNQIELNNSQITTEARRQGNAGNLALNVEQLFVGKAAEISASTRSGIGGGITLQGLETLEIDAGAITASTRTGEAGNVRINASDSIDLRNQGRLAVEATGSNGEAGNLMISTDEFTIQNGAATVSSAQGRAGNLLLTANSVQLDQARLTAETAQTGGQAGANITLNGLQTLSLRNQSQISANARESANGGNLTINADFILARPTEDSDIRANAIAGNGGNIAITTQGLFGTQPADAPIAGVSDITASSERGIQGVVAINNPNPNPTQGLEFAEAPPETIPLAQECAPITELNRERSSFVVVGRGGVSPSPYEALRSDDIWQDWRLTEVETEQVNQPVTETSVIQTPDSQMPINEAQGWIRNTAGQVQLVAIAHTASSAPPALPRLDCSDLADLSTQSGAEQ